MKPAIFLALPTYDGARLNALAVAYAQGRVAYTNEVRSSALAYGFNKLWCTMLHFRARGEVTHWLMMHADVKPTGPWVDTLVSEMEAHEADIVSTILPIKSHHGLTSTGLETDNLYAPRRLTMREVHELPETWTDPGLVWNTGLWLADIRGDWVEKVHFEMKDEIVRTPEGKFVAAFEPEDWNFARQCRALGLKAYVTRKVAALHSGAFDFTNAAPWGELEADLVDSTPADDDD
jgi:hypothetical protein